MQARDNFPSDVKWYNGAGCLVCGSNYSNQAVEAGGPQCVDLEIDDPFGRLALCFDHAREAGRLTGMVPANHIPAMEESATTTYDAAAAARAEAEELAASAAADREVIERLMERVMPVMPEVVEAEPSPESEPEAPKRTRKPRAKKAESEVQVSE